MTHETQKGGKFIDTTLVSTQFSAEIGELIWLLKHL